MVFSVAFGNQSGGYELRNPYFKGCMGSKDLSIIAYSPGEIQEGCLVLKVLWTSCPSSL